LCFDEIIVVAVYDATRIPFNSYAWVWIAGTIVKLCYSNWITIK
jgi:uncharacterized membrane protein YdjX (TVP38/TMEM64 family)